MACTKYTLAQYQTLIDAIASGATKVQYGDKTVEYRNLDEMLRIRIDMEKCLFPSANANVNNGRVYASFSKGTNGSRRRRC